MVKKYHRKQQYQEMSGILLLRVCMNSDRVNNVKSSCSLDNTFLQNSSYVRIFKLYYYTMQNTSFCMTYHNLKPMHNCSAMFPTSTT